MPGPTASVPTKRLLDIPGQGPEEEAFLSIAVALASELSVVRARLDTLERVLERSGTSVRDAIETFEPTPAEQSQRDAMRARMLDRVFRVFKKMADAKPGAAKEEAK